MKGVPRRRRDAPRRRRDAQSNVKKIRAAVARPLKHFRPTLLSAQR